VQSLKNNVQTVDFSHETVVSAACFSRILDCSVCELCEGKEVADGISERHVRVGRGWQPREVQNRRLRRRHTF